MSFLHCLLTLTSISTAVRSRSRLFVGALLWLAALPGPTYACDSESSDCVAVGKWDLRLAVGLGLRTNPLTEGDNIPLLLLPQWRYNGEHFFVDNLDLGAILWEGDQHQLNLLLTPSYDQIFFDRWNPANVLIHNASLMGDKQPESANPKEGFSSYDSRAMHNRRLAWLGGLEYTGGNDWLNWQVQWLSDISDRHNGQELRLSLAHQWHWPRQSLNALVGAQWQSAQVLNYYYGESEAEVGYTELGSYRPGSGTSALLRLDWNYQLTRDWDLRLLLSYRRLSDAISASPLVDTQGVTTLFVGGVYHF